MAFTFSKIQIMGGKVCLRCKGKTLKTKSLLTSPSNFPVNRIFTEGDRIEYRLSSKIFSTLTIYSHTYLQLEQMLCVDPSHTKMEIHFSDHNSGQILLTLLKHIVAIFLKS